MFFSSWKKPPPEETVPKKEYDILKRERDTLIEGNTALTQYISQSQEQIANLTSKYSVLGFDEALVRSLAQRAIALLQRVDTTRTGGAAFKQEIDVLVGEARSAGLIEEKSSSLSADR